MKSTKPPDSPDDGPAPERMTPRRLAAKLHQAAEDLGRVRLRLRSLGPYLGGRRRLASLLDDVAAAEDHAVDLGADVRAGRVELAPDLVDGAHVPERPLIDHIEARAIDRRLSDEDRERLAARGDAVEGWQEACVALACRGNPAEVAAHAEPVEDEPPAAPTAPTGPGAVGDGNAAPRRKPRHGYTVAVRDPHGQMVGLGGLAVPARTLAEARCYAGEAYGGKEYRDSRGVHRQVAEADLVVTPSPSPSKADRKKASRAKPVANGTITADQWTEEHTAAVRDGFAEVNRRFAGKGKEGGAP